MLLHIKLPSVQSALVYPGLHPLLQCPVCLLHGKSLKQLPLQLWTQLNPKLPSSQSVTDNINKFIHYVKMNVRL